MQYLDGRHGDGDVEVPASVDGLHHGDAVGALHVLRRVLPRGDVDRRDDVAGMGVEPAQGTSNGRPGEVLERVELDEGRDGGPQHLPHHFLPDDRLAHHRLPSALYPVHRRGLLVRAVVPCGTNTHGVRYSIREVDRASAAWINYIECDESAIVVGHPRCR